MCLEDFKQLGYAMLFPFVLAITVACFSIIALLISFGRHDIKKWG